MARHYAGRRSVPAEHVFQLDLPLTETISRAEYEQQVVLPIRKMLESRRLTQKIRVLVTTYGIPLRIEAPLSNKQEQQWIRDATERQRFARAYLQKIPEWAATIAPQDPTSTDPSDRPTPKPRSPGAALDADRALLERVEAASQSVSSACRAFCDWRRRNLKRSAIKTPTPVSIASSASCGGIPMPIASPDGSRTLSTTRIAHRP